MGILSTTRCFWLLITRCVFQAVRLSLERKSSDIFPALLTCAKSFLTPSASELGCNFHHSRLLTRTSVCGFLAVLLSEFVETLYTTENEELYRELRNPSATIQFVSAEGDWSILPLFFSFSAYRCLFLHVFVEATRKSSLFWCSCIPKCRQSTFRLESPCFLDLGRREREKGRK